MNKLRVRVEFTVLGTMDDINKIAFAEMMLRRVDKLHKRLTVIVGGAREDLGELEGIDVSVLPIE